MKFVGLALQNAYRYDWVSTFLNASNHAIADPPLDGVSFHFYGGPSSRTDPAAYEVRRAGNPWRPPLCNRCAGC